MSLVDSKYQWKSKEVEAFLFAAQEQALSTNIIKSKIYGQSDIFYFAGCVDCIKSY